MDFDRFDIYLGGKLYEGRVLKRLTQDDMAKLISEKLKKEGRKKGISRQAYAFYEKGERSMPMDVFTHACSILSLNRNQIFNEACDDLKLSSEDEFK